MTDGFRWMPVAAEMNPFEAEIGGDQHQVATGKAQDGAVIADANANSHPMPRGGAPNPLQQWLFLQRHRQPFGVNQASILY